jgi:HK97 family phage portal protein
VILNAAGNPYDLVNGEWRPADKAAGDLLDAPVEIAPGQGDLRRGSEPFIPSDTFAYPSMLGSAYGLVQGLGVGAVNLVGDGKTVSYANIFATQQWVAAAVMRLLTWSARVPLKVYRRTGDDSRRRLRADEHPLAAAIETPWDRAGRVQLVMALLGPLLVHGNSTIRVDEGRSGRIQFATRDWRRMRPIQVFPSSISGWETDEDGGPAETLTADQVLHLAWWSPLGPIGVSPLQQLGVTISVEEAAQRFQRAMLANSARPPSAVTADKEFLGIDRDERTLLLQQLREDITTLYAGPENGGRPALLPPGLDWKAVGHTAVEAALIEQRRVAREEVAAVYQIPPPMIGILDKATYANITVQREMAYTDALGPPLVLIEEAINAQVIRALLREPDLYVEFDFAGVLRGDRLKEVQAIREAIGTGVLTPNEGRRALNYPASTDPLADELFMPANNLQPLSNVAATGGDPGGGGDPNIDQ